MYRKKQMLDTKSTGFSNNLQTLRHTVQSFIQSGLPLSQVTPDTPVLFGRDDVAYLNAATSLEDVEQRLRTLDRRHLSALVMLKTLA